MHVMKPSLLDRLDNPALQMLGYLCIQLAICAGLELDMLGLPTNLHGQSS